MNIKKKALSFALIAGLTLSYMPTQAQEEINGHGLCEGTSMGITYTLMTTMAIKYLAGLLSGHSFSSADNYLSAGLVGSLVSQSLYTKISAKHQQNYNSYVASYIDGIAIGGVVGSIIGAVIFLGPILES